MYLNLIILQSQHHGFRLKRMSQTTCNSLEMTDSNQYDPNKQHLRNKILQIKTFQKANKPKRKNTAIMVIALVHFFFSLDGVFVTLIFHLKSPLQQNYMHS